MEMSLRSPHNSAPLSGEFDQKQATGTPLGLIEPEAFIYPQDGRNLTQASPAVGGLSGAELAAQRKALEERQVSLRPLSSSQY
jgi:hypothetical protein